MASSQLKLVCYCGSYPYERKFDNETEDAIFSCKSESCLFYLQMSEIQERLSIPTIHLYRFLLRKEDGKIESGEIKSYREDKQKVWLEYKKKIPKQTFNDLLKENNETLMPYKSCYCRAVANSIASNTADIGMVKQLMGIEAYEVMMMCNQILCVRKEDMKLSDAIDKYFTEARMLVDEEEIEKKWLLTFDSSTTKSIQILNILSDELRNSEIWSYCVKDIAKGVLCNSNI